MLMENCKIQRKNYKIRIEFHALQNKVIYNTIWIDHNLHPLTCNYKQNSTMLLLLNNSFV